MTTAAEVRAATPSVGDRVRVRSREDILATLGPDGSVNGLPFMPEMLSFAGRTLPVDAVVNRTCDTISNSGTTRGMQGTVHLAGARCDGSAHGGCQARCLLYWREEWLEPATADGPRPAAEPTSGSDAVPAALAAAQVAGRTDAGDPLWRCQATEVVRASCFVSPYDVRTWASDVKAGNGRWWTAMASASIVLFNKYQALSHRLPSRLRIRDGRPWPFYAPTGERRRPTEALGLQPGDLVEVKPLAEIEATLDDKDSVRGLRFSGEMLPYCGKQARVLDVIERIIDERSGRMLKLRDCVLLEDVWCAGTFRLMCRRKIFAYWRESWLRRVDEPSARQSAA